MRLQRALVAAVVAALMVLAACSSAEEADETPTPTPTPTSTTPTSTSSSSPSPTPTPTTSSSAPAPVITDPLTGLEESANPVVAVKVDNTSFPQYGLADADIIYTEQVEGGLTRLIAIYHSELSEEVGPVRSIRSSDLELLPSYGAIPLVNSGGNKNNRALLAQSILMNVAEGDAALWRSSDRGAPYNVHANIAQIVEARPDLPEAQSPGFVFALRDPARLYLARDVSRIETLLIGSRTEFDYVEDAYRAFHAGTQYVDADGREVIVDNVLVQHVQMQPDGNIDPAGNPSYMSFTTGTGEVTLYRDGKAIDGTWSREEADDPVSLTDDQGRELKLKPGKTWIILATQNATVTEIPPADDAGDAAADASQ